MNVLDARHDPLRTGRRARYLTVPALPSTADASGGMENPVTVPRTGNISSDTRAGILGW
ncbi:MAG: hypothetical protein ACRDGL_10540 [Candidatus Limnocylindrales bacterium]